MKISFWLGVALIAAFVCVVLFLPDIVAAAPSWGASGFESKLNSLTNGLINVILPAVSVLGLIYAAILLATGDAAAKQRMIMVVIASVIGFLAPLIIGWFRSVSGG